MSTKQKPIVPADRVRRHRQLRIGCRGLVLLAAAFAMTVGLAESAPAARDDARDRLRINIVYNNVPFASGLQTDWGFAAVVEGLEQTLLFDTGGDGAVLLANMKRMGIDPEMIDGVFLSHAHGDHTDGLDRFLRRNPAVTVYMPASFPPRFQRAVAKAGGRAVAISAATKLFERAYSTGPMGRATKEQALVLDTPTGLVIMTGCAHPGIVDVVREAKSQREKEVRLLMGGFHLLRRSESRIRATIDALEALGVAQVAPSHCTGDRAIARFRKAWGEDFLDAGCGAVIELDP
jgi:7,8-dihydropterin-6-yl-methyl-4-(beta-D-ribofuranosyl)aminobenzene 5'-phosphate synthase